MSSSNLLTKSFNPLLLGEQGGLFEGYEQYVKKQKKNQVRQIIKSYHQTYDHFLEALQNAIDACEYAYEAYSERPSSQKAAPYEPHIQIHINIDANEFTVVDNGIGMKLDEVERYFISPYATLKPQLEVRQRGEKGVGNTFLAYGSKSYRFSTRHFDEEGYTSGKIDGGILWALGSDNEMPLVQPDELHNLLPAQQHGTVVQIQFSEQTNIKRLADHSTSLEQWEVILRLHTGIGYIDFEDNDAFLSKLNISLYVIYQGEKASRIIQKGYLYPHKISSVTAVRKGNLDRKSQGKLPLKQTMKDCLYDFFDEEAVRQKALAKLDAQGYTRFGPYRGELRDDLTRMRTKAYLCFVWANAFWDEVNNTIFGGDTLEINHGLLFATKSQRIVEPKKIEFSYRSGDYNRFLVLLNMDKLEADIGRKSIERRVTNLGNLIADAFHDDFVDDRDALKPTPRERREDEEVRLEALQERAISEGEKLNLPCPPVALLKVPREEQDVVALFFNLLGSGYLKGYKLFSTHISQQYDAVAWFEIEKTESGAIYDEIENPLGIPEERFDNRGIKRSPKRNFLEFKMSTDDLVLDIQHNEKQLKDIKWLVCWSKGKNHEKEGIDIDEILEEQYRGHREFYGVTDIMRDASGAKVHIICLEKVIEILSGRGG